MKIFISILTKIFIGLLFITTQAVAYIPNTHDPADRLTSASVRYGQGDASSPHLTETFLYNLHGALTNWTGGAKNATSLSLTYDPYGQLTCLATTNISSFISHLSSFSYDPLGNRLTTSTNTLLIPDHADPLKRPLVELDAATGDPIRYYLWADNRLLGFIDAATSTLTLAHCDDFGSVIALTETNGVVTFTAAYGPHGEDWGTTGHNPTPFAWLGVYGVQKINSSLLIPNSSLELYLTRHRLYSATLNRFLSPDPLGLAGGLNLYQYGEGNPMAYIDPLGLAGEYVLTMPKNNAPSAGLLGAMFPAHTAGLGGTAYIGGSYASHMQYANGVNATRMGVLTINAGIVVAGAAATGVGYAGVAAAPAIGNAAVTTGNAIGSAAVATGNAIGTAAVATGNAINTASLAIGTAGSLALSSASQWGIDTANTAWTMTGSAATTIYNASANAAVQYGEVLYNAGLQTWSAAQIAAEQANNFILTHPGLVRSSIDFSLGLLGPPGPPSSPWEGAGTIINELLNNKFIFGTYK